MSLPSITVEVRTQVRVQHGNVVCEARPDTENFIVRDAGNKWEVIVDVADVLSLLEALGNAYDWRKRKLMEQEAKR